MKTIIYLIVSLALAFQVEVIAQENNNGNPTQPLKSISKVKHGDLKKEVKDNQKVAPKPEDVGVNSDKKIQMLDKQIAELEKLKSGISEASEEETLNILTTRFKTSNSQKLVKEIDEYFALQSEADFLINIYSALIEEAGSKNKLEQQQKLFEHAEAVFKAYELKQINMSNVFAQINYAKFRENKATIQLLLVDYEGGPFFEKLVNTLVDEAEYALRMAMEIRVDADKQLNNSARLACYSNAEEKESVALSKQSEAIDVLERTSFVNYINQNEDLVYMLLTH